MNLFVTTDVIKNFKKKTQNTYLQNNNSGDFLKKLNDYYMGEVEKTCKAK